MLYVGILFFHSRDRRFVLGWICSFITLLLYVMEHSFFFEISLNLIFLTIDFFLKIVFQIGVKILKFGMLKLGKSSIVLSVKFYCWSLIMYGVCFYCGFIFYTSYSKILLSSLLNIYMYIGC